MLKVQMKLKKTIDARNSIRRSVKDLQAAREKACETHYDILKQAYIDAIRLPLDEARLTAILNEELTDVEVLEQEFQDLQIDYRPIEEIVEQIEVKYAVHYAMLIVYTIHIHTFSLLGFNIDEQIENEEQFQEKKYALEKEIKQKKIQLNNSVLATSEDLDVRYE